MSPAAASRCRSDVSRHLSVCAGGNAAAQARSRSQSRPAPTGRSATPQSPTRATTCAGPAATGSCRPATCAW